MEWIVGGGIAAATPAAMPAGNQAWREPLRNAMDWLRDELAPRYEQHGRELFKDPWTAARTISMSSWIAPPKLRAGFSAVMPCAS